MERAGFCLSVLPIPQEIQITREYLCHVPDALRLGKGICRAAPSGQPMADTGFDQGILTGRGNMLHWRPGLPDPEAKETSFACANTLTIQPQTENTGRN